MLRKSYCVSPLLCFLVPFVWLLPSVAGAADLEVYIMALRNKTGSLRISLYDRAETFPKAEGRVERLKVNITTTPMQVRFPGLQPGTYAVTVHHDENDDGKLNKNIVGIPQEGYGFSNDPPERFQQPSFRSVAVPVGTEDKTISITMIYW